MQKLAEIKGLSDSKVEKLLDAARKLCSNYGWQTAKNMEIQVSSLHSMACMCTATSVSRLLGAQPTCTPRHARFVHQTTKHNGVSILHPCLHNASEASLQK